ncbi:MAG: pyrroline-5-carboxylate reductase [Candidatus Methylacidiphilales bacterium]
MKIALIGTGKMGCALVGGMLRSGLAAAEDLVGVDVTEAGRAAFLAVAPESRWTSAGAEAVRDASVVLLAVKPNQVRLVLQDLAPSAGTALWVTVAAGVPLARYVEILGSEARVVRVMPNTPVLVNEGMAAYAATGTVRPDDVAWVERLFNAVGRVVRVDESALDAVTAVSGSGPAYFYKMFAALAQAGAEEGLDEATALQLAAQTARGAAKMILDGQGTPEELAAQVTSKGGTTEAALIRLETLGLAGVVAEAVRAAARRSRELAAEA